MDTRIFLFPAFLALKFLLLLNLYSVVVHGATTSICNQTPYPELCNSFMVSTTTSNENQFIGLRDSAISVTLDRAEQTYHAISAMDVSSFEERAKSAWADCLELYEDSVDKINRSINPNIQKNENDIQTWLSAALTDHQTCKNGFLDFNLPSYLNSSPFTASNISQFLVNSLAINKATSATLLSSEKNLKGRRLLSHDDFPEWMLVADRKLLQEARKPDLVVAKDGSGDYMTIMEAVTASVKRRSGSGRFKIYVKRGVYKENVEITKSMRNLMLFGDGIDATVVTGSKYFQDGTTTFRTATFATSGDGFMATDMTFENTAGPQNHQAVALKSAADFSVFYRCSFKGYQDTLYVYSLRQFYRNCDIYGTVDFIFGNAAAVFQSCKIYVRKPMNNQFNTVTAQHRTDSNEYTGIVIHDSIITAASDLKAVQGSFKTYLGRPWGYYSRTVVMKSSLDSLISPLGWTPWDGVSSTLSNLYYGEYMNTGSGASTGGRVKWPGYHVITSSAEAGKYSVGSFLIGNSWIPETGVPFSSGL
ncbi:pectinesterase-like [Apium graveolens]|uniref:pectinesterase-like n=1 Tax=Apium graveolens TaxID=4045 RepID=UPI003D7BCC0A